MNRTIDNKMNLFRRSLSEHQIDLKAGDVICDSLETNKILDTASITLEAPTVVIEGGNGDCVLQIKADKNNSGETDNPTIEFIQDGDGVNSTIGCGILSGQSNGNSLVLSNAVPSASEFAATGGILFKTGRTGDVATSTERLLIHPDGNTKILGTLEVTGNVEIPDGGNLFLGDSNDFQIQHTGSTTFIDEQGTGDMFIRTNGTQIAISDTTASTNYMARFIKDGAVEMYHNKVLRMSTTPGGVLIGDAFSHNATNIAFTTTTAQFCVGGTHNSGQPSGSPTVKLLLTGTDNDDNPPVDYHAVFVDENGNVDFSARVGYEASGSNIPEFTFRGLQLNTFNGGITASGAGFSDAVVKSNIRKIDNEIITTILIDLDEGPIAAQTAGKIIGKSGSSNTCEITQVTAAKNGYVYKAELNCIEAPNAAANLDLVFASSAQTPGSTTLTVLIDGAVHNRGNCEQVLFDNLNIDNKFLHLATGATDGTADYTAGKFILKLYGANF